jgi:DNA-binding NarL/FixJ family response regulator
MVNWLDRPRVPEASSTTMAGTIGVLLVIADDIARRRLVNLLAGHDQLRVVGEASSCATALASIARVAPQVVVVGETLPDATGAQVCAAVRRRHPQVASVVLVSSGQLDVVAESLRAGANGFGLDQHSAADLVTAVAQGAVGWSGADSAVTEQLLEQRHRADPHAVTARLALLSALERRVLQLLAQGLTNAEISRQIGRSPASVKTYVSSILRKLRLDRREDAASYAPRLEHPAGQSDPDRPG